MIPLEPKAFTAYYSRLMDGAEKTAALVGIQDHHVRARLPMLELGRLGAPLESPVWGLLSKADSGNFKAVSSLDGIRRDYHFRRFAQLPLVMITGFSDADVQRDALQNIKPIAAGTVLAMLVLLTMAYLLSVSIQRRDEQDRFLSMISHELRTPMSVISVLAGTLAMPEEARARIARAISNMNAIIDSALQADRLRHDKVQLQVQDCDLPILLQDLCHAAAEPERLQLDASATPKLRTDHQLLHVIVNNLIVNALKYSAPGTPVQIQALAMPYRRQPGVGITVSNAAGPAGKPDARQVFHKYYRAPGAHGQSGSGLGLHIAEGLARLLGGHLRHRNAQDQVQFTLWIPL